MNQNHRGRTMPVLPPLQPRPRALRPAGALLPTPAAPLDTPGAAYTLTCDAGHCDRPTVAVVCGVEGAWLSMCAQHTAEELLAL